MRPVQHHGGPAVRTHYQPGIFVLLIHLGRAAPVLPHPLDDVPNLLGDQGRVGPLEHQALLFGMFHMALILLKPLSRGNVRFIYAEPNKTNERTRFSWLLSVRLYSNNCSSYCGPFPDSKSGQKAAFSYQTLQLPTGKNTMLSVFLASVISGVSFALLSAILKSIMKPIFNIFPALSAGLYLAL